MYRFKRILAVMDLDPGDRVVAGFAGLIARLAGAEAVHFIHAHNGQQISAKVVERFPELGPGPARGERLAEAIDTHFEASPDVNTSHEVVEGVRLLAILDAVIRHDVDLVIAAADETGLGEKITRKAPCSVLIVPPEGEMGLRQILVPVDFSDHAADAVDVACAISKAAGLGEVTCLYSYRVPRECRLTDEMFEETREILEGHAEVAFQRFIDDCELHGVRPKRMFRHGDGAGEGICAQADESGADLIVLGARGRSTSAAVLLGSVAEQVIRRSRVPLLAVKRKGAGMGMLKAILEHLV